MKQGDEFLVWRVSFQNKDRPGYGGAINKQKMVIVEYESVVTLMRQVVIGHDVSDLVWVGTLSGGEEYFLVGGLWHQIGDCAKLPASISMAYPLVQQYRPSNGYEYVYEGRVSNPTEHPLLTQCSTHKRWHSRCQECYYCVMAKRKAAADQGV